MGRDGQPFIRRYTPLSNGIVIMKKIPSFTIDHILLKRGIYVSRQDVVGDETVTTFDVRM